MNVLMFNRPDVFTHLGGDCVQTIKTAEALRRLGTNVTITTEYDTDPAGFDIVHLFNITRVKTTLRALAHFKKKGVPVVLSTIYWNADELESKAQKFEVTPKHMKPGKKIEYFVRKNIGSKFGRGKKQADLRNNQRLILESVRLILPNSKMERELIFRDFLEIPSHVVPNAVDRDFFSAAEPEIVFDKFNLSPGYILCAARFDERKNQLKLIECLKGTRHRLVLAGLNDEADRTEYENACIRAASNNVALLPKLDARELAGLYLGAVVHALPSWYDTPGLSSLEAGLAGCRVVASDRGSTSEYFQDMAWYCDPEDAASIRHAVERALEAPANDTLKNHILAHFTWEKTAEATLSAYRKALENIS
jgi:glycosyltransferase involved in cell wall biosynthesis